MTRLRVLNVVTSADAEFFQLQVGALERLGVECATLAVPGKRETNDETVDKRSVTDYLRLYPRILKNSFDDYDLIHANYGLTAPLALAQPNLPVVLSLWGSDLFGAYGPVSRWCAKRCRAVVVMSDEMARALDSPCHVIPHGVDMERFAPRPQEAAQAELGWRRDVSHVLFPYPPAMTGKNYPRAERVVDAARDRLDTPVELQTVYGVPHERMPVYMNAADALLLPSDSEGSPNTVKEALACGLPVVATDVGDVAERLDGVSPSAACRTDAELVDALVCVLARGERSNGREKVRNLSVEWMGRRLLEVYETVSTDTHPCEGR